jgi:hypothetical protein
MGALEESAACFASRGHFAKRPKTLIRWPLFPLLMCLE